MTFHDDNRYRHAIIFMICIVFRGGKDVPDFKYPWMGKIGALIR